MDEKRKQEEIHELTDDEIDELVFEEQLASGEYDEEVPEYYFSNPDPYAKVEPRPDDAPKRKFTFDEKGNRKNHSTLLQTVRRGHQRRKEKRQGGSVELHSASTGHAHAVCQSQPPAEPDLLY